MDLDHLAERLRPLVEAELAAAGAPGASVALRVDGQPVFEAGVGSRDLAGREPLAADARLYIYSITKTLIAAQLLRLAEEGHLDLDAPAGRYLPDIDLPGGVTVRRLLNHTAGLPDYGGLPAYHDAVRADPAHPWSDEEFWRRTLPLPRPGAPGEHFAYSNIGYLLLKRLLHARTGRSLRELLDERVFAPLGLVDSFVAETLAETTTLAPGFSTDLGDEQPADISRRYHPGWVSHGVVVSTAPELARLGEMLFDGRLLSPGSLSAMLTPIVVPVQHPLFARPAYGLGLMLDLDSPFGVVAGHAGGGPGYSAGLLHFPDVRGRRATAAALVNGDNRATPDSGLRVAQLLGFSLAAIER